MVGAKALLGLVLALFDGCLGLAAMMYAPAPDTVGWVPSGPGMHSHAANPHTPASNVQDVSHETLRGSDAVVVVQ